MAKKTTPKRRDNLRQMETQAADAADIMQAPMQYRRKQALTTPLLSVAHTPHLFLRLMGPVIETSMPAFAKNETGTVPLIEVCDLESGEVAKLIVPAVLLSALERMGDYVGKSVEILAKEPRPGKAYRDINVWELGE